MKLNSISKREAVRRLEAWQARQLDRGSTAAASAAYRARHGLEGAEGETLFETYSRACDQVDACQRVHDEIMKEERDLVGPALLAGAGSLALGVSTYLGTGNLDWALICTLTSAAAIPLWHPTRYALEMLTGKDYTGVATAGFMAGVVTLAATGAPPEGWQLSLAAAAMTTGGLLATALGAKKMAGHHGQLKATIEENLEAFNLPPRPGPSLSSRCSRQIVLETLDKLINRAVEGCQFEQARELQQERRVLAWLEGSNFLEMFEDSQARQPAARVVIQKHAAAVLQEAHDREQIEAMARGSGVTSQLVVSDELVDVGGQCVPVRD